MSTRGKPLAVCRACRGDCHSRHSPAVVVGGGGEEFRIARVEVGGCDGAVCAADDGIGDGCGCIGDIYIRAGLACRIAPNDGIGNDRIAGAETVDTAAAFKGYFVGADCAVCDDRAAVTVVDAAAVIVFAARHCKSVNARVRGCRTCTACDDGEFIIIAKSVGTAQYCLISRDAARFYACFIPGKSAVELDTLRQGQSFALFVCSLCHAELVCLAVVSRVYLFKLGAESCAAHSVCP